MFSWVMNKLVYFSHNKLIFRAFLYARKIILKFYDPIIEVSLSGEKLLYMNFSHQIPIYLAQFPLYDTALARLVKEVGANYIIDVGANVGDGVALIKFSNVNVKILCVEGNTAYSNLLKKNYPDDDSIVIEEVFCSDINERKDMYLSSKGGTASFDIGLDGSGDLTTFYTLDEIVKKHPEFTNVDLIKVDTDGFDYKVIRGSLSVLKSKQPFVFFELDKKFLIRNNENIMSVFELFENCDYNRFILYDNYGYLLGLFNFTQLAIVNSLIDYMYKKEMYLDVLMIKDVDIANKLFESERLSIDNILGKSA